MRIGAYEACEIRDGGKRYNGKGVLTAVNNVNNVLAPALLGKDETEQRSIDEFMIGMDGTPTKIKLGMITALFCTCTYLTISLIVLACAPMYVHVSTHPSIHAYIYIHTQVLMLSLASL